MVSIRGQKVYLDSNTIIYVLEGFAEYSNLKTGLLDALDAGDATAVTSELTLVETVAGPRKATDAKGQRLHLGPFSRLPLLYWSCPSRLRSLRK